MTPLQKLRGEFQKFADDIVWSNDDGSEKYIGIGNMADWWLSKFSQILNNIEGEVEGLKIKSVEDVAVDTHNYALDAVKSIISKFKE